MKYHAVTTQRTIKRIDQPIFDEAATVIEITDDAAGCYLKVSQNSQAGPEITIDYDNWPVVRREIDRMLKICEGIDKRVEG